MNLLRNITSSESHGVLEAQPTAINRNQPYQVVYRTCLTFVVRFLLPLAALAFFNQRLVRALHQSDQLRHHSVTDGGVQVEHVADTKGKACQLTDDEEDDDDDD